MGIVLTFEIYIYIGYTYASALRVDLMYHSL